MGRKKVCSETLRASGTQRKETFGKRTRGLFKKAHELAAMCGCAISLTVAGEDGRLYHMHRLRNPHLDRLTHTATTTTTASSRLPLLLDLPLPPLDNHHFSPPSTAMACTSSFHSDIDIQSISQGDQNSPLLLEKELVTVEKVHADAPFFAGFEQADGKKALWQSAAGGDVALVVTPVNMQRLPAPISTSSSPSATAASGSKLWYYNHITEKMESSNIESVIPIDPSSACFPVSPCPCPDCLTGRSRYVGRIDATTAEAAPSFDIARACKTVLDRDAGPSPEPFPALPSQQAFDYYDPCEEKLLGSMSGPISSANSSPGGDLGCNAGDHSQHSYGDVDPKLANEESFKCNAEDQLQCSYGEDDPKLAKVASLDDFNFLFNLNFQGRNPNSIFDPTSWLEEHDFKA